MSAPERLTNLIELATQDSPPARNALARELCDLLLDWPDNYPQNMREPFEALLEKTLRVIDRQNRDALVHRIAERPDAPLALLNEFYFGAGRDLRSDILMRNAHANGDSAHDPEPGDLEAASLGASLVEAARTRAPHDFAEMLSRFCALNTETAESIVHDVSGESLAVLAKGAHLGRAAFSAIAMLTGNRAAAEERLSVFDSVPQAGAESLLRFWQARNGAISPAGRIRAA